MDETGALTTGALTLAVIVLSLALRAMIKKAGISRGFETKELEDAVAEGSEMAIEEIKKLRKNEMKAE